jgi:beta-galactosidase GanA
MTQPTMSPADRPLPELREGQFILDGRPTLLLGGQLHNSLPSSPEHVVEALRHVRDMHVGTVIGSANWAQVEPAEGSYDFSTVDAQLDEARRNDLRLVLIWFGAFKNAASTYAPRWVRADTTRYPRAKIHENRNTAWTYDGQTHKPVLSVFSHDLRQSDKRAFCRLMEHLAEHDTDHTVVMVQIENEVGVLGQP